MLTKQNFQHSKKNVQFSQQWELKTLCEAFERGETFKLFLQELEGGKDGKFNLSLACVFWT